MLLASMPAYAAEETRIIREVWPMELMARESDQPPLSEPEARKATALRIAGVPAAGS
jgi:hypothetical protein